MRYFDNALHMMEVQGGSFVRALAHVYYAADEANRAKLVATFKEYFDRYELRFQQWRAEQANAEKAA